VWPTKRLTRWATAITLNGGFVARSYAGDQRHLTRTIKAAVQHRGFALVDILQPCVTFNKINTYQYYRERVYDLDQDGSYDRTDRKAAWEKSWEWGDRIPIGILYQVERPTLADQYSGILTTPLVRQERDTAVVHALVESFKV